jgi:hypothetical protein
MRLAFKDLQEVSSAATGPNKSVPKSRLNRARVRLRRVGVMMVHTLAVDMLVVGQFIPWRFNTKDNRVAVSLDSERSTSHGVVSHVVTVVN